MKRASEQVVKLNGRFPLSNHYPIAVQFVSVGVATLAAKAARLCQSRLVNVKSKLSNVFALSFADKSGFVDN